MKTECMVKVRFGTKPLEDCIEKLLRDKEKNSRQTQQDADKSRKRPAKT